MADIEVKKGIDGKDYKVISNTWYEKETDDKVIFALEYAKRFNRRLHIFFCYPEEKDVPTDWDSEFSAKEIFLEEYGTIGRIGRSSGSIKVPLLLKSSSSYGGEHIVTDRIGLIIDTEAKETLYHLNKLFFPALIIKETEEGFMLMYKTKKMAYFEVYARSKNRKTLERLQDFLLGLRHTKGGR